MRTKISALSLQQRKQKILENHWRIGDLTPGLEQARATKQQRVYLRNRVYTPNTELKHKNALKHFYESNEYGVARWQEESLQNQRQQGHFIEEEIWEPVNEPGKLLIIRKKLLKKFKVGSAHKKTAQSNQNVGSEDGDMISPKLRASHLDVTYAGGQRKETETSTISHKKKLVSRSESPMVYDRYTPYYYNFVEPEQMDEVKQKFIFTRENTEVEIPAKEVPKIKEESQPKESSFVSKSQKLQTSTIVQNDDKQKSQASLQDDDNLVQNQIEPSKDKSVDSAFVGLKKEQDPKVEQTPVNKGIAQEVFPEDQLLLDDLRPKRARKVVEAEKPVIENSPVIQKTEVVVENPPKETSEDGEF